MKTAKEVFKKHALSSRIDGRIVTEKEVDEAIENKETQFIFSAMEEYATQSNQPTEGKELKDITDEDAIECSKLIGGANHLSSESQIIQLKQLFSSPNFYVNQTNIPANNWLKSFQYLQSRGYKLPVYFPTQPTEKAVSDEVKCDFELIKLKLNNLQNKINFICYEDGMSVKLKDVWDAVFEVREILLSTQNEKSVSDENVELLAYKYADTLASDSVKNIIVGENVLKAFKWLLDNYRISTPTEHSEAVEEDFSGIANEIANIRVRLLHPSSNKNCKDILIDEAKNLENVESNLRIHISNQLFKSSKSNP